ncbi:hypothetical protein [Actinoplanes aureus]|uniref:HEAT repeat domain-containing protein n=1 Tax=Actinoplanes aureus TaxID=2792083 RepID=A0A931G894_9ACTN|nr:hypothetical protein [Actinoplanes aureus]MBG0569024.1 hypothetical protein [Actinoplanes aureus]
MHDVLGLGYGVEGECNHPHWEELLTAVRDRLATSAELSETERHELLYVLARENEDERIAAALEASPRLVEQPQARWQIAIILPCALGEGAVQALKQLAQDDDEYVRRRALAALSALGAT